MYLYKELKPCLFSDKGQIMLLKIRDHVQDCLHKSGAVTMGCAMKGAEGGDTWMMMACVDRLVEIGDIREIIQGDVAGQDRIFVRK